MVSLEVNLESAEVDILPEGQNNEWKQFSW